MSALSKNDYPAPADAAMEPVPAAEAAAPALEAEPSEKDRIFYRHMPQFLVGCGRASDAERLATSFEFHEARLRLLGEDGLRAIGDFFGEFAADIASEALKDWRRFLESNAHILTRGSTVLHQGPRGRTLEGHWPANRILLQLGLEHGENSAVTMAAEAWTGQATWMRTNRVARPVAAPTSICRCTLEGHGDAVLALAFRPDGKRVASASADGTIRIWDVGTGRCARAMTVGCKVNAVAFRPGGHVILSGGADGAVKIWDAAEGAFLRSLDGHDDQRGPVHVLAVSPDGRRVATGQADGLIRVYDLETGHCLFVLGHGGTTPKLVRALAFCPESRRILAAGNDRRLTVWDATSGVVCGGPFEHRYSVTALAIHPDGRRVFTADLDSRVFEWDIATGSQLRGYQLGFRGPSSMSFDRAGRWLIVGCTDNSVLLLDPDDVKAGFPLRGHTGPVRSVASSPIDDTIVSASGDRTLRVWAAEERSQPADASPRATVARLIPAQSGLAVALLDDGAVEVWDVGRGVLARRLPCAKHGPVLAAVTADGLHLVTAASDGSLVVWNIRTGTRQDLAQTRPWPRRVVSLPGGRVLTVDSDLALRVWSLDTHECLATLRGHKREVTAVEPSPDGRRVAVAGQDVIDTWNVETGQAGTPIRTGQTGIIPALAWLRQYLCAAAGNDGTIAVMDTRSGRLLHTLTGHTGAVNALCGIGDGTRLLSAGEDGTLRVWDTTTGGCVRELIGHSGRVWSLALLGGGRNVVSASWDRTLRIWDLEAGAFVSAWHAEYELVCCTTVGTRIVAADRRGEVVVLEIVPGPALGHQPQHIL